MSLDYKVIRVITSEEVHWNGKPLYEAILEYLKQQRIAARCLVTRGIAGLYETGELVTQTILDLSFNMPIKIEIFLPAPELDPVLARLDEMVSEGIVAYEDFKLVSFKSVKRLVPKQLRVKDVMTVHPQTVPGGAPLREILEMMLTSSLKGIPIIDEANRVIGIITQRDLMTKVAIPMRLGLLQRLDPEELELNLAKLPPLTAHELMSKPVITVRDDQPLSVVIDLMLKHNLKRIPVVNAQKVLVGMIARVDIFRIISKHAPKWQRLEELQISVGNAKSVKEVMRRDMLKVQPETPIDKVIDLIYSNDIQRIAVVDQNGHFLGLISDYDLLPVISSPSIGLWDLFVSRFTFTDKGRKNKELMDRMHAKTAAEIMNKKLFIIDEDAPIEAAVKLMTEKNIKRLPVVDANGVFKGLISRDSVLRVVAQ